MSRIEPDQKQTIEETAMTRSLNVPNVTVAQKEPVQDKIMHSENTQNEIKKLNDNNNEYQPCVGDGPFRILLPTIQLKTQ